MGTQSNFGGVDSPPLDCDHHGTVFGRDNRPLRTAEELAAEREKMIAKLRELGVDADKL